MSHGIVGQGTVISLSSDTTIGRVRTLQLPEWLAPRVDFTSLDEVNWMAFLPGSPTDPGQAVSDIFFDPTIAIPTIRLVQTLTVTFPIMTTGNTTNAVLSGSGFVTNISWGNVASAQPVMRGFTFAFDGIGTPPVFTIEAL